MTVTVYAPAKINLTLDITGRRDDGYHYVDMVMQSVSLYDTVTVTTIPEKEIKIICSDKDIPCDCRNTAYKAAELFYKEYGGHGGAVISINKQIPSQAGLAGGSSDAAAVLIALNKIYDSCLTPDRLSSVAGQIGADVPFCLYGGTMRSTGIGTKLKSVTGLPECFIVLVKPPVGISTKEAYALSDSKGYSKEPHSRLLLPCLEEGNIYSAAAALYNDFEQVLCLEPVQKIKEALLSLGAQGACMSGSGPTVFGIFTNEQKAYECAEHLTKDYKEIFVVKPVDAGCFIPQTE